MNKKKRVLSLVMALVMALGVLAVMPMTVSAEDAFDYRTAFATEGANGYIGYDSSTALTEDAGMVAVAPDVTDGEIGATEYPFSRTDRAVTKWGEAGATCVVTTQYVTHDDEWVYLAFEFPSYNPAAAFQLYLHPLQVFDDASASYFEKECVRFVIDANTTSMYYRDAREGGSVATHVVGGSFATDANTFSGKLTAADGAAVIEMKFSKAALAESAGVDVKDFTNFRYMARFQSATVATNRYLCWPVPGTGATAANLVASTSAISSVNNNTSLWAVSVNLNYDDIKSADLGQVRIDDTAATSGLRFQTTVSKAYLAELEAAGYTVEAGTIIAPDDANLTMDADGVDGVAGEDYLDVEASLEQPYNNGVTTITFTGSIVNIKAANLSRDFTAVGYLKLTKAGTTTYVYSNEVTKNVSEIAAAAIASGKYTGNDLTILQGLVGN